LKEILAVIPARGGSVGVPRKNIRQLAGKPLIAHSIEAAQAAPSIDRVIVTTDDPEIAAVAREWRAEVPFLRPAEMAQNDTPGMVPLMHAIRWLDEHDGYRPAFVMELQPTSPLRTAADIEAAFALARDRRADAVVSVGPVQHHPYWMKTLDAGGRLRAFMTPEGPAARRQDLPAVFAPNGAIYLARRDILLQHETFDVEQTFGYMMPAERSLDIDTEFDFQVAALALAKVTT
jgi:CMP-N,N'-diacetyllegionaminic acid synthase